MTESTWLYRHGDLILGPVPSAQLLDKLFAGEITGSTEVQRVGGGRFLPVKDFPELAGQLERAEATLRKKAEAEAQAQSHARRNRAVLALAGFVLVLVLVGLASVGRYLAVHGLGGESPSEITIDPPVIGRATRGSADEYVDYATRKPGSVATRAHPPPPTGGSGGAAGKPPGPRYGEADSDGLAVGEVDQAGIDDVVRRHQATLVPCLKVAAEAGLVAKVPIEFAIGEGGKVSRVWVDEPSLREGPLPECLLKELQRWPFKPTQSASVRLSFNLGKKGER